MDSLLVENECKSIQILFGGFNDFLRQFPTMVIRAPNTEKQKYSFIANE